LTDSEEKIRVGISTCLLGKNVRYDGGHKLDHYITETLGKYVEWVPVCPEVEYGLPVPREAMRLVGSPDSPSLVTIRSKVDHTEGMKRWAHKRLKELVSEDLCGFIFKSKSPSSGYKGVKVYSTSGMPSRKGTGIFAGAFVKHFPFIPVEDEGRLHDPQLRENFIERIFVFRRWKEFLKKSSRKSGLASFHTDHKLLLMSHSQKHYSLLGRMVAGAKKEKKDTLFTQYITLFMEGLKLIATVKKNTNVLTHTVGYFKNNITSDEKAELLKVIDDYYEGLTPLIVPVTLINHYVRKYDEPYLKRQHYFNPHPLELMLRNHV
jgi:uncharacterized protein YbgA (DUF1722 family)/uncharacterized protein YbbK (DUF523 family)